jgi:hypothetical protein
LRRRTSQGGSGRTAPRDEPCAPLVEHKHRAPPPGRASGVGWIFRF